MIDQYDNFCLDEKCDTNTKMILEKSKQCPVNYRLNEDGICEDIDECAQEGAICPKDQICVNRKGFFECLQPNATFVCETGLVKNGQACVDVDECTESGGKRCDKNQRCINLIGSYECVARPKNESISDNSSLQNRDSGALLDECEENQERDHKGVCVDIDFCAKKSTVELCGLNANCSTVFGQVRCDCHDGYSKNETGQCEDKNECETGENNCMETSSTCRNLVGSYECVCRPGYEQAENDVQCVNINECQNPDVHKCHHDCLDNQGSFECRCNDGYDLQADNRTCVERNHCHSTGFCSGICERISEGNYNCKQCPTGLFRLNRETEKCFPINECEERKERQICPPGETCIDLKNGQPAQCVDLTCPEDYGKADGVCTKRDEVRDRRPLAISKRVIRWPLSALNSKETKTLYRIQQPNEGLEKGELEFEIVIDQLTHGENAVDASYFKLVDQKVSHNLLIVKPVLEEQHFILDVNVVYNKRKILHQSRLYVFVV